MPAHGKAEQARELTSAESSTNFSWTKDNQVITDQNNVLNIFNPQTGVKSTVPMAQGEPAGNPSACSNGQYVVFDLGFHSGGGAINIWRMDAGGGILKQLSHGALDGSGVCSPDGQWVYYMDQSEDRRLARVSINGGESRIVSQLPISGMFDISADGKWAAFATLEHSGEHKERLAIVPLDPAGAANAKVTDLQHFRFAMLRFSPDGTAVVYPTRENGVDNLWRQPLDGSPGKYITDFKSERIYDFHWSFDGKQLALVRGHTDNDIVLIRDMQQ